MQSHTKTTLTTLIAYIGKEERMSRLQPFGDSIWIVDGPEVDFFGCPYPTRMVGFCLLSLILDVDLLTS
jgi:hypothetical protein